MLPTGGSSAQPAKLSPQLEAPRVPFVRARGTYVSGFDTLQTMKDLAELLELPADQRLQLVETIWDSLLEIPEAVPLTDDLREELDRRLAAYYDDPSSARPWREIKDELFGNEVTFEILVSRRG